MKHSYGDIDVKLLNRLLNEAYEMGLRRVGLYTIGEMFLCKEVSTHIANAKQIGYEYIYSDTNGMFADRENLEKVINAGLDSIKFSINAGTRETYRMIHGHDSFYDVLKNLKICSELKGKLNEELKIMVSYIVTKQNENEIEILNDLVRPYITEDMMVHPMSPSPFCRYGNNVTHLLPMSMARYKISSPCEMVLNRIHVTYDGYLTACCQDFNQDLLLADLKKTSLKEAWSSPNAVSFRKAHLNNDLVGTLCYNCVHETFKEYFPLSI
jgi:radical SAM protein with 4Fe4S-binding SPASM domain